MEVQDNRYYDKLRTKRTILFIIKTAIQILFLITIISIIKKSLIPTDTKEIPPLIIRFVVLIFPLSILYSILTNIIVYIKYMKGINSIEEAGETEEEILAYIYTQDFKTSKIMSVLFKCIISIFLLIILISTYIMFANEGFWQIMPVFSLFSFIITRSIAYKLYKYIKYKK